MTKKTTIAEEGTPAAASLQTKSAMMSGLLAAVSTMSHEQMMQWFADSMELAGQVPSDAAAKNQASIQTGKGQVAEDAKALFAGDNLTEEAQTKISTLIEHAVSISETLIRASLEEEYDTKLTEATVEIQEAIASKVDQYLSYSVNEWQKANEVAIESALRTERTERLLSAIGKLVAEAQVEIPEGTDNVVENLQAELAKSKNDLAEQIEANIASSEALTRANALNVFRDVAEGLTKIDIEKFKGLVENMEVTEDTDEMRSKLVIIREAHFNKKSGPAAGGKEGLTEAVDEAAASGTPATEPAKSDDNLIQRYADAMGRLNQPRVPGFAR